MKITFEGKTFDDIIAQMEDVLEVADARGTGAITEPRNKPEPEMLRPAPPPPKSQNELYARVLAPVDKSVEKSGEKRVRTEKQLANDEKLRERAAAKKAAGLKPFDKNPAPPKAVEKPVEKAVEKPEPEPEMFADPAEAVKVRQKTITDLQEAYANGHQQEVFELLSRFGNGAKSFRELPPEAFGPIREAIDKGALT